MSFPSPSASVISMSRGGDSATSRNPINQAMTSSNTSDSVDDRSSDINSQSGAKPRRKRDLLKNYYGIAENTTSSELEDNQRLNRKDPIDIGESL